MPIPKAAPASSLSPQTIFSGGRLLAVRSAPYFQAALLGLIPVEAPGLGTIAVTDRAVLLWDPEAVRRWTVPEMAAALVHEVMHVVLKHHARGKGLDQKLDNYAGDLAINPAIAKMGLSLPSGPLMPSQFGWEDGLTKDEYYARLRQLQADARAAAGGKGKGKGEAGAAPGNGDDGNEKPGTGKGWCGSCAGRPVPNEPDKNDADAPGRSEAQMARIERQVAEAVRDMPARGRGELPADLVMWAEDALKPPRVPWRQQLRHACRSAVAWASGAVDHRYDGVSRRQAGIGYGPGSPMLPRLRRPVPNVLVAADTSGSMGLSGEDVLREINGVIKAIGAEVTFIACDAEVHAKARVRSIEEVLPKLQGGGGTDFRPVFAAMEQMRPRPEILVFLTDGMGSYPSAPPAGVKVIWTVVGHYKQTPPWGHVIDVEQLDDEG